MTIGQDTVVGAGAVVTKDLPEGVVAAGLILHGPDGHDHLRLQLLDSEEVELEAIVCDSPFADTLRQRVLEDMARVSA